MIFRKWSHRPFQALMMLFSVVPFVAIDTIAMAALVLGLADVVIHFLLMILRHRSG